VQERTQVFQLIEQLEVPDLCLEERLGIVNQLRAVFCNFNEHPPPASQTWKIMCQRAETLTKHGRLLTTTVVVASGLLAPARLSLRQRKLPRLFFQSHFGLTIPLTIQVENLLIPVSIHTIFLNSLQSLY
jgi:hypothetical protein